MFCAHARHSLIRNVALTLVFPLAAVAATTACTPTIQRHGYAPESEKPSDIEPLTDTEQTVLARFGNPSTRGMFDDSVWYYVTDVRTQLAYLKSESSARSVVAIHFDDNGVVSEVSQYGLENGRTINLVDRKTPTRGRELSVIEQLLGTVGRLPSEQLDGQQNLPGGAGGPDTR